MSEESPEVQRTDTRSAAQGLVVAAFAIAALLLVVASTQARHEPPPTATRPSP